MPARPPLHLTLGPDYSFAHPNLHLTLLLHGRIYCSGPNGTFALGFRCETLWHGGEKASCPRATRHTAERHERRAHAARPLEPLDDPPTQASAALLLSPLEPSPPARGCSL